MAGIVFLGPPGSGKGTQSQILAQSLAIPHISTGEILREAIANETELGKQAKAYVDGGELVPDELLLDLIRERLTQRDAQTGWILDGFPRNIAQAAFLDELLAELGQSSPSAIDLKVPQAVLIQRLMLRGRKDDTEETIRRRLQVYEENTAPLIEYYQQRDKLLSIDGDRTPEEVAESLKAKVS
jgi:adenylate kinase